jgi:5-(carboxyamino)imidazole ribonucleotide synthase
MVDRPGLGAGLPPGSTIGILGGGQLGRMLALDARRMGYRIAVLDPSRDAPAAPVADVHVCAPFGDAAAARSLAEHADVVTFEVEHVPLDAARAAAAIRPVFPSLSVIEVCQHRVREREFLDAHGFPVAPWRVVADEGALRDAAAAVGWPCLVKIPFAGYDGRGQIRLAGPADIPRVVVLGWERAPFIVERHVPFVSEMAVIVARRRGGEIRAYPVVQTVHDEGILVEASTPAAVTPRVAERAREAAESVAAALGVVGVIAVEMFALDHDEVLINELAPRPHNSGHHTIESCPTSQFAQHIRAICDLPLGDVTPHAAACMINVLGTGEGAARLSGVEETLAIPGVAVHLYGKAEAWRRRKMGHVTALAPTADEARARARRGVQALRWVVA